MKQVRSDYPNLLVERHKFLKEIREYFEHRDYIEVQTPLLAKYPASEVNISPIKAYPFNNESPAFLVSSPEYFMKRLLAKNPTKLYQISHSFRQGEISNWHNPEFLMLEWYNPNFNYLELLHETLDLIKQILKIDSHKTISFTDLFKEFTNLDPFSIKAKQNELANFLEAKKLESDEIKRVLSFNLDEIQDYIMAFFIQPNLGADSIVAVIDYPTTPGILAIRHENNTMDKRFECFYKGIELCNGFEEQTDTALIKQNLAQANVKRKELAKETFVIDSDFIADINNGLPKLSGVALGLERLLALKLNSNSLLNVQYFYWQR